jgi:hypothetical protein
MPAGPLCARAEAAPSQQPSRALPLSPPYCRRTSQQHNQRVYLACGCNLRRPCCAWGHSHARLHPAAVRPIQPSRLHCAGIKLVRIPTSLRFLGGRSAVWTTDFIPKVWGLRACRGSPPGVAALQLCIIYCDPERSGGLALLAWRPETVCRCLSCASWHCQLARPPKIRLDTLRPRQTGGGPVRSVLVPMPTTSADPHAGQALLDATCEVFI